ncbi:hypothetical protein COLO4_36753 [Corchorus olitorius]|uniref:Uncharacterized protein n=1 Tax=Corchorus olitorius TaxID=93759 RepID=A0A1R3G5M0_9ROSI|nr:hypothetical protein COLO4_36753 [Corchorus olitorius]
MRILALLRLLYWEVPWKIQFFMPDPLPSVTSSSLSQSTSISGSQETPHRWLLWPGGTLSRLHAPRSTYNFKDDMEVFSPLVDVQPITPSLDKFWNDNDGSKKPSPLLFPSSRRFAFADDGASDHPIFDWKSSSTTGSTSTPSSKNEETFTTPPEAWGFIYSGQDQSSIVSQTNISSLTSSNLSYENLCTRDVSSNQETSLGFPEHFSSSSMSSFSLGSKSITGASSLDSTKLASLALPQRFSTYAGRISATSEFSAGTSHLVASPKTKNT